MAQLSPAQIAFVGPTQAAPGYTFSAWYQASPAAAASGASTYLLTDAYGRLAVTFSGATLGVPQITVDTVKQSTATFCGGTIATANASQTFLAANTARRGYTVQNQSTGNLWLKVGKAATADYNSLLIAPGVLYETPPHHTSTGAIYIIGATAGQAYYGTEIS